MPKFIFYYKWIYNGQYNYINKQGGIAILRELGLKEGDTVRIEDFEFEFTED